MTDLLLTGIGSLTTNDGPPIAGAVVAIADGIVTYAGKEGDAPSQGAGRRIDCEERAVIPGFVDAHTHLVFAGDRSDEFARRLSGEAYASIAAAGGGILSTVAATRSVPDEELFELARARALRMLAAGTTTLEVKSGYGLDLDTERRLLEVGRRLGEELPVTVKTTLLGAHAVPPEFATDREGYIDLLTEEMIPALCELADYCDVFVEQGVFEVEEARRIFTVAGRYGLRPRVHACQLSPGGGAKLAAELGAASADHLDHATSEDAAALAGADVAAVLLPGASYTLGGRHAPARMLWDAGCTVALATDCNPGTSYLEGMGLVISLAVVEMGLTPEEALWASTRGGALSLGLDDRGLLVPGARADIVVLDAPHPTHIPYRPATNLVWRVVSGGKVAVPD
ncbi:MAG: imidazolonepropionase [Actinobacteria bacterium]|nr:imidazolonepropionase [Actinomycetota bacterium]